MTPAAALELNQLSDFGDNPYAHDAAYEGADFNVDDRKGMSVGK